MTNRMHRPRRILRFEELEQRRQLATFVVSNTEDSGEGSLRQAILNSNASPDRDTIDFFIEGLSRTIELKSALPYVTDPVTIDGTTQPGYSGKPVVELTGRLLSNDEYGLILGSGFSVVKGLVINQFPGAGILVVGLGLNRIESNYLGTDLSGRIAKGNGRQGVEVLDSSNNLIGGPGMGNLTSGNGWEGIRVWGSLSHSNRIQGNLIGTDADGLLAVPNLFTGLVLGGNSRTTIVGVDGTGADNATQRNLISGNGKDGIEVFESAQNVIAGNWVGLDATGKTALGNQRNGIILHFSNENRVGTNADGTNDFFERNHISGNVEYGIRVAGSSDSRLAGNWVGITSDGLGMLPNQTGGVLVDGNSLRTTVGSGLHTMEAAAARNVISGNSGYGIRVDGSRTTRISSNFIGVAPDGKTALPNSVDGLLVSNAPGSSDIVIGTNGDGIADQWEGNTIAGNLRNGIWLWNADFVRIAGNRLGLSADGTTAVANQHSGIWISNGSQQNLIGTDSNGVSDELERNLIAGNAFQGVAMGGYQTDDNRIAGNFIGTDSSGLVSIPNLLSGVLLYDQAQRNTVGGTLPNERNVISGNVGWGVEIRSNANNNSLLGNWIGLVGAGLKILGNSLGGISISQSSSNKIGNGMESGSNRIVGNGSFGLQVTHPLSTGNSLLRNSIGNHRFMEIDLGGDGPTPNDRGDQDTGPNELLNYPFIDFVANSSIFVQISGRFEGAANTLLEIDLYSEQAGLSERQFIGSRSFQTDNVGLLTWTQEFSFGLPEDAKVYATARTTNGSQSEFSPSRSVGLLLPMWVDDHNIREGDSGAIVTIWRPGMDDRSDLVIDLKASVPNQIALPPQVTIPAGQPLVQFSISSVDDLTFESSLLVEVVAKNHSGEPAMRSVSIRLLDNDSPWRNYASPMDVDKDGQITALDVLAIVNYLNSDLSKNLFTAPVPNPPIYLDTIEDQSVSALDALFVINFLNSSSTFSSEGEEESLFPKDASNDRFANWFDIGLYAELVTNEDYISSIARRHRPAKQLQQGL